MSDIEDEKLEAAAFAFRRERTCKSDDIKHEQDILSAATLVAERKKFWEEYNQMEELDMKDESAAVAVGRKLVAQDDTNGNDAVKTINAYLSPMDKGQTISLLHPGIQVLNKVDVPEGLDAVNYAHKFVKMFCSSTELVKLNTLSDDLLRKIILRRSVLWLDKYSTESINNILKIIYIIMAVSKDDRMINASYVMLHHYRDTWQMSLSDVLDAFLLWGIPRESLCTEVIPTPMLSCGSSLHDEVVRVNPSEHNVEKVLEVLEFVYKQTERGLIPKNKLPVTLLRAVFWTAVDMRFRYSPIQVAFRRFVYGILKQVGRTVWENDEEITQLSSNLYFRDLHPHNQAFYCTVLLSGTDNQLTRPLQNYLATRLVRSLLGTDNTDELRVSECNLASMLTLLSTHKEKVNNLKYYQLYILLGVVRSYVQLNDVSYSDRAVLNGYIAWILNLSSAIRSDVHSGDLPHITSTISTMHTLWAGLASGDFLG